MVEPIEFDGKWQELKRRFGERLVVRFRAIDGAWEALMTEPDDQQALSILFHQVHSLAGSGATFGYESLSVLARELEPLLDPVGATNARPLDPAWRANVQRGLSAMRNQARSINASV